MTQSNTMNKINYIFGAIAIIAMIVSVVAIIDRGACDVSKLGGYTAGYWDCAGGYKVAGTTVIDSSGNVDATITSDTGTFSSTLTVSGETNVDTLVYGGDETTISIDLTYSNQTTTAAILCNSSVIHADTNVSTTFGLPTGTALIADCIPAVGDTKSFLFHNFGSTTDTGMITLTASSSGAGLANNDTILLEHTAATGGAVAIREDEMALVTITNLNGVSTTIAVIQLRDAD